MCKRKLCTSIVPYNYYNNDNLLFGFGLGIFVTVSSGIFAMFYGFSHLATKDDLNNGINRLDKKIDDSNEMLRREIQTNTQLVLERMENMLLKSKK